MTTNPWTLSLYTIYKDPTDYPGHHVVREHKINDRLDVEISRLAYVCSTLEQARKAVPAGCLRLGRMPEDDPCIVEVWV